jgi:hypothetical protein
MGYQLKNVFLITLAKYLARKSNTMKTTHIFWRWAVISILLIAAITISFLPSCEKEELVPVENVDLPGSDGLNEPVEKGWAPSGLCGKQVYKRLLLGNQEKVGDVYLFNDADFLYVRIYADQGTLFRNVYLYVGPYSSIPLNDQGNPLVTDFTYKIELNTLSEMRRFRIPLSEVPEAATIALHVQTRATLASQHQLHPIRPAWAEGKPFGTDGFGRLFYHKLGNCEADPTVIYLE